MSEILHKIREVDPNDSEAVKEHVTTFFQNLSKTSDSNPLKWLRTLSDVINRFPKYCMSHRGTVESLLILALDSTDYYYVIEAAKCAQALQQVRPSQEKTATPKSSWRDQMDLLCNAAHSLIAAVFPNAVDMYKDTKKSKKQSSSSTSLAETLANITSIPKNNQGKIDKQAFLQARLKNVLCFIQAMLVEIYPVAKPVRPQEVLDVVVRALSVSSGPRSSSVDVKTVKSEALRTLDALVACLGPNLIPFSPLVFRLLMQTFRWTSENPDKNFSQVRCMAYNSLTGWLSTLHAHRTPADSRTSWEDELTSCILNDIAPPEKLVQLTMGPQPTKHMSKKAKRKLANAKLIESNIASHMPGEKNKIAMPEEVDNEVSIAALECAETFLLVCGRFLKPTTHKLFQERAVRECYNAGTYGAAQVLLLLRVSEACRRSAPPRVPPPTQHCLLLYSALVNSADKEISKFCTQALLDIRLHLHCSPPSLNFALEVPQETQKSASKRKKVSEKNRAALETLLGKDRVAELEPDEEIVTIPDEPSSKKPRVEDVSDNISISSESVKSVEISDDSDEDNVEIVEQDEPDGNKDKDMEDTDAEVNAQVEVEKESAEAVEEVTEVIEEVTEATEKVTETMEEVTEAMEKVTEDEIVQDPKDKEVNVATVSETMDTSGENVQEEPSIHTAPTQVPRCLNGSTDTLDGEEEQLSLEVSYDYPNTRNDKITILNEVDDEALPSTCETDDVQITCGQAFRSSEDTYVEKRSDDAETEVNVEVPKVNGVDIQENNVVTNGINKDDAVIETSDETKVPPKDDGVSIEDMMADFVDEVVE